MKHSIYVLIILNLLHLSSLGQGNKLVLQRIVGNGKVNIKKNHNIIIHLDSTIFGGEISAIGNDYIEVRVYGRNIKKMEYEILPFRRSKYDKQLKQGWHPIDSLSKLHKDSLIFMRSTNVERIPFEKIKSIEYRKIENTSGPGLEVFVFGVALISSPLWNYGNGKYNWSVFAFMVGVLGVEVIYGTVEHNRYTLHSYDFKNWKIKKTK